MRPSSAVHVAGAAPTPSSPLWPERRSGFVGRRPFPASGSGSLEDPRRSQFGRSSFSEGRINSIAPLRSRRRIPASASAPNAALRPTRLQREAESALAIDVEYVHLSVDGLPRRLHLPVEVCVVDSAGAILLREMVDPLCGSAAEGRPWRREGGVPVPLWRGAAPLVEVRARVAALTAGRPLVGHNLIKDLKSLGIDHPAELRRDTMRYKSLRLGGKSGRRLVHLAQAKLGREIQVKDRPHDAAEDAVAAMDLYLRYCHFDTAEMSYEDLVEYYAAEALTFAASASPSSNEDRGGF